MVTTGNECYGEPQKAALRHQRRQLAEDSPPDTSNCRCPAVGPKWKMKKLTSDRPFGVLQTKSLLALTVAAYLTMAAAVPPKFDATDTAPTTASPATVATAAPTAGAEKEPQVTPAPTQALLPAPTASPASEVPTSSALSRETALTPEQKKELMRQAIPEGGAEMGQRSPRVLKEKGKATGAGSVGPGSAGRAVPRILAMATDPNHWRPSIGIAGQDVSGHQGIVDWQAQWNHGSRWAYVKASEGNYYLNERYSQQYNGSRNVGMVRGAYHFAIPNWSSGADQARYFVANGGGWSADGWTLPPVLDIEYNPYEGRTDLPGYTPGNTCYDLTHAQMRSWISEFGNTVKSLTGRLPVIYSTTDWWTRCTGNASGFGDYPLWIAAYPYSPSNFPGTLPASWSHFSMWQYSSTGPFAGDSNIWNGDHASLRSFALSGIPQAAVQQIDAYRASHLELGSSTTAIYCGLANGGCYQGFNGGTVMWSPATGAFAVTAGAIAGAWRATGAEGGVAGYPTSDVICGLKDNGCFQNFQGGSILSSPNSGAALVRPGAIRDYWAKSGFENGLLGYPTGNTTCGLRLSGCFQLFQAGPVLSSSATPAHLVKPGPIFEAWARGGYENGLMGYPTAEAVCDASSCTQNFMNGVVAWTAASGAWPVYMGIAASWKSALERSELIGFPIGTEVCGIRGGGCYQLFQGGVLLFSPATGAHTLTGKALEYWQKSGFENGSLGYPTSFQTCGLPDAGCLQPFEHGTVAYSASTAIQAVPAGAMRDGWNAYGSASGALGYPTSAPQCGLVGNGCFQMFTNGALMHSPASGAHPSLVGPIRDLWQKSGFQSGSLSYPVSTVLCGLRNGGCFQNYLGGSVLWSQATGANALLGGPIRDAWVRSGFENGALGYPVSAQTCGLWNGGCFQNFEKGSVLWSPGTGAQAITSAAIQTRWAQSGYESGSMGYPTSGSICGLRDGGCFQNFEKGSIMWSPATGAHPMVGGPIQQAWAGQGFENGGLGYPSSPQTCSSSMQSCSQTFQGGRIEWTATGGVKIVQ